MARGERQEKWEEKDEAEYENVTAAMEAMEEAYRAVFAAAREEMPIEEIDTILMKTAQAFDAEVLRMDCNPFVVSPDEAPPKLGLTRAPLKRNAFWGMDHQVRRKGYFADLGRYGYIGDLPDSLAEKHSRVLARQELVAAAVLPGRSMKEIFRSCPHEMPFEVHRIGRQPNMLPMCGNATRGVLEAMERSEREGLVFEVGQVVCVEVWAGLSGGIEDMYLVEPAGLVRISTLPRGIHVVRGADG